MTQHGFPAGQSRARRASDDADVIVVGAGPGGSSAAYHLARAGLDVLLLEKSTFPREKVCGDGLTPRAVKQLVGMGITPEPDDGWFPNKGIRIIGGGVRIELDWPELSSYPGFGLVRTRRGFDEIVARAAQRAGARLAEGVTVTGPVLDEATGRITGVTVRETAAAGKAGDGADGGDGAAGAERTYRARLVVAADGNSSRLSLAMGLRKRDDRPLGVAIRTYYTSPRHDDDYLETWLELWDGNALLPGYGWIFGVGDGTSNVGLGLLNTSASFGHIDYRAMLRRWLASMPAEWGFTEENRITPVRGAALPMGFNRTPHYTSGLLLVGDAGGMVNPFNGEGIAYRDGVRRDRRAGDHPGAGAAGPGQHGTGPAGLPAGAEGRLRWLLHSRTQVRRGDRPSVGHEVRDPAWATAAGAHALHYETPGKPDRAARRRRCRPGDQCAIEDHACGLAGATAEQQTGRDGMRC